MVLPRKVVATIDDRSWSILSLLLFGAGTIAGMMILTAGIAIPFTGAGQSSHLAGKLRIAAGFARVGFGPFLAYQTGVVQGLLSQGPL